MNTLTIRKTLLAALAVFILMAEKAYSLELVRTVQSKHWERIECYRDYDHPFSQENYLEKARHADPEIVAGFGSEFPITSTFLLHYGKKWKENKGKVVILLHGATHNATWAWAEPEMWLGKQGTRGMLAALEDKGYRVFALTFPHKHGNLFYEAEYLAGAIAVVRAATGAAKVTVIGHSSGGLVGRMYVSSYRLNDAFTAYRGDVERLVTLASPHRGQDFAFRHPEFNFFLFNDEITTNAPMAWDKMLYYGSWRDSFKYSIYSDNFPMQQQLLTDWTDKYPVNVIMTPDWYTTINGGQGFMSHSRGIKDAIMRGGNFMKNFRSHPVDPEVAVTVMAGTNTNIKGMVKTETDGPSDGLIFVESASDTGDMSHPDRKNPILKFLVDVNHLNITYQPVMLGLVPAIIKQ